MTLTAPWAFGSSKYSSGGGSGFSMKAARSPHWRRCAPSGRGTGPSKGGHQSQLGLLEIGAITLFSGNTYQFSSIVEVPGMVETTQGPAGAFVVAAYHGSPVGQLFKNALTRPSLPRAKYTGLPATSRRRHSPGCSTSDSQLKQGQHRSKTRSFFISNIAGEVIAGRRTLKIPWSRSSIIRSLIPIGNPEVLLGQAYIDWIGLSTLRGGA